ncbi:MAG: ribonuclease H-like domain-containing protein [Ferruginibacter sp.]
MLLNISLNHLLFIDIETVPVQPKFNQLTETWQQLWIEKAQKICPDNVTIGEFYEQRAGVMAEFSKVVCISTGYFILNDAKRKLVIKSYQSEDETVLLKQFINGLELIQSIHNQWVFAGHNIKEFDIPFICRRLLANGISIPPILNFQSKKPWETTIIDTFQLWRFGDYKNYTSLALLAKVMGISSPKDDMDGSKVSMVFWEQRDYNRIKAYCERDVFAVAQIILRFMGMPILTDELMAMDN